MHSNNGPNRDLKAPSELSPFIDHTLLKADATVSEIEKLCSEAKQFGFKGVCVNSTWIPKVASLLAGSNVLPVSVVGFPLGAMLNEVKAYETERVVSAGAKEVDTVIAIGSLKSGDWKNVEDDLKLTIKAAGKIPVKVILETGLLSEAELVQACKVSEAAGAAFVKTATGFLGRGASLEDIRIMRKAVSNKVQIKASGGVKTFAQARELILAGADRLGTSSGVALVTGKTGGPGY